MAIPHNPRTYVRPVPTEADRKVAAEAVAQGYVQTSRAYRRLAKLPDGVSGYEALCSIGTQFRKGSRLSESTAADLYRRCYAPASLRMTMTQGQFTAYLDLLKNPAEVAALLDRNPEDAPLMFGGESAFVIPLLRETRYGVRRFGSLYTFDLGGYAVAVYP